MGEGGGGMTESVKTGKASIADVTTANEKERCQSFKFAPEGHTRTPIRANKFCHPQVDT